MWRCVPGSTFFSPHHCNPGDRLYTQQFTQPPTTPAATPTPTTPAIPAPVITAPVPAKPTVKLRTVKLSTKTLRLDRLGRFALKVTCVPGPSSCRTRVLVTRSGKALATRTVTIKAGKSATVHLRPTTAMRRTLKRGRAVSIKVSLSGTGLKPVKATTLKIAPSR